MTMKLTRRDLLALTGGSALGVMLTPAPWKLIDDLAIWTQNWSWIPVPPKGPETAKMTTCALCPSACAMRARCIGGQPVSLHALAGDPASGGSLCALGMTAHHLPWHPARPATPIRLTRHAGNAQKKPLTAQAALQECSNAVRRAEASGKAVAVLDMRPDRSASSAARAFLAQLPNGLFVPAPGREGVSFLSADSLLESGSHLGADLARARTILSFGAPLAEGWGSAATLRNLLADPEVELIHVEPVRSQTAQIADRWLPARPRTEGEVALAIAHVLLSENLVNDQVRKSASDFETYAEVVSRFTPERVAASSGLRTADIVAVARQIAARPPALVIAGEDAGGGRLGHHAEVAILGLNLLLGNVNAEGGLLERGEVAPPAGVPLVSATELDQLADGSVGVLLIDASAGDAALPWTLVSRKLAAGAEIIALSPFLAGTAKHADIVIPTPVFLETVAEVTGSPAEAAQRFAVAAPLIERRIGSIDPVEFFGQLAEACGREFPAEWSTTEEMIRARVQAIHASGRGAVLKVAEQEEVPLTDFDSPEALYDALLAGGRWTDNPTATANRPAFRLLGDLGTRFGSFAHRHPANSTNITLLPHATRDVSASAACSPVLTKIYQESELRPSLSAAAVNPATIRELGLGARRPAILKTASGTLTVRLVADESVMPGTVRIASGPDGVALGVEKAALRRGILDICDVDENGVWRSSAAQLVEA